MKRYKNAVKKKLSIEGKMMLPGDVMTLDENLESVKFYEKHGMLVYSPESEEHTTEAPNPSVREMTDTHAEPVKDAKPQIAESRPSVSTALPGAKEAQEQPKTNKFGFAESDGSIVEKGRLPGQGSEKTVSTFIKDTVTAGQKELGSVVDNAATVISPEVKKK